jgi:hypothetical protein
MYFADTEDLGTGTFTVEIRHGNARGLTVFTVGLSTGSGPIEFQTTKDEYSLGDQVLILGRTGNSAVLHVEIVDSSGTMIRTFETFSDKIGTFKIDGFRIPSNADPGKWSVSISSDANTSNYEFSVVGISDGIEVSLAEPNKMYNTGEIIKINGKDAVLGSSVDISITNSNEIEIEKLNIFPKSDGSFYTIWIIPNSLEVGIYKITVTNGDDSDSVTFNVN